MLRMQMTISARGSFPPQPPLQKATAALRRIFCCETVETILRSEFPRLAERRAATSRMTSRKTQIRKTKLCGRRELAVGADARAG
jgi:hypothetical protein